MQILLVFQFAVCVCIISPLPLAISSYLIGLVITLFLGGSLIPRAISGFFQVTQSGKLTLSNEHYHPSKVLFAYAPLFIVFSDKKGRRWSLWRDSLTEKDYRRFLVYLRYLKKGE